MTEIMKAVGLYRYLPASDEQSLQDLQIEKPVPAGRDLLVRVKAVSINPVDVKVRAPKARVEETPKILGWDVAGVVEQTGPDTSLFQVGDEVYYAGSLIRQGGNSEFHLVDERIVGRKPANLDFASAAALPLTAITAWEALFERLAISKQKEANQGKKLLIIGAAGGVGSIALQLAREVGLTVIGTASRPESEAWVRKHGADLVISHYEDFLTQLQKEGIESVDYILCLHSTEKHWKAMEAVIKPLGRICSIVETKEPLDLTLLKNKSITFAWEFMFTRSKYETEDMIEQHRLLDELADWIEQGRIQSTLTETISPINAANLRKAHLKVEENRMIGKLVLENFEG
ncbi:zinc-binding alcohol dehydrogenase family protein [Paenibacillus physcomitrellae]|uniref:Zinc-type alcohol dehydrogenase-like protein n=1 Tax=Paenibacillus physcomitrellae TaxID=1619311 RepID=A0ABQ1G0Q0_9BACL|nr:zinc-binding alcohol dehydrogenase family protein [Paenibacillus physcomitrellae]GGA33797.1 NADPH:quinone reductase [Paenibacillus physcomitrellae]